MAGFDPLDAVASDAPEAMPHAPAATGLDDVAIDMPELDLSIDDGTLDTLSADEAAHQITELAGLSDEESHMALADDPGASEHSPATAALSEMAAHQTSAAEAAIEDLNRLSEDDSASV